MNRLVTFFSAGIAAVLLSGNSLAATEMVVTPAQIAAAKTPAEHEAIAKTYDDAAAAADKEAAEHVQMAKTYRGGAHKSPAASLANHCDRLAKSSKSDAAEYRAMAAEHREMAKAAGK